LRAAEQGRWRHSFSGSVAFLSHLKALGSATLNMNSQGQGGQHHEKTFVRGVVPTVMWLEFCAA
jgi:hypothetical protein